MSEEREEDHSCPNCGTEGKQDHPDNPTLLCPNVDCRVSLFRKTPVEKGSVPQSWREGMEEV